MMFVYQDVVNRNAPEDETRIINGMSQGDRLNHLKAARAHVRSASTGRVQ